MTNRSYMHKRSSGFDGAALAAVFIIMVTILGAVLVGNVPLKDIGEIAQKYAAKWPEKETPSFYFVELEPTVGAMLSYDRQDLGNGSYDPVEIATAENVMMDAVTFDNTELDQQMNAIQPSLGHASPMAEVPQNENVAQLDVYKMPDHIRKQEGELTQALDQKNSFHYEAPLDDLMIEAVLVPQQTTVISSSHDGKIAEINADNGDTFKKGDALIRYDCGDIETEAEIAEFKEKVIEKKAEGGYKLFNLDLISESDRMGFEMEEKQASARTKVFNDKLEHCTIRARFDGRVTARLANPGEYTRTDRVLMEVASTETLDAEFLIPSVWLRWINIGAPLRIVVGETGLQYDAEIIRIYGEVDPVSQSIQVRAKLAGYDSPLLPGMSGQARLNVSEIRQSGVRGFLEPKQAHRE